MASAWAKTRVVRVGVYDNAPKIFMNNKGQPAGILVDVLNTIAKKEGWTLVYIAGEWRQNITRLDKGEIDLLPDIALAKMNEEKMSFHKIPVLSSWSYLYAKKGHKINSLLDLNNKRIAILNGSVQQQVFGDFAKGFDLHIKLIPKESYYDILNSVAKGNVDAGVVNNFYANMHADREKLVNTNVISYPSQRYYTTKKGYNLDLLAAIDRDLKHLKEDPNSSYYASLRHWSQEDIHFEIPIWVKITALLIFVALLISFIETYFLKERVLARTHELRLINKEMETRVIARTAEAARATEEAKKADDRKTAFLAIMSHELRTPLNSIIGFTGILLQELAGSLNEEQHKQLRMVKKSAVHLLSLVNDILDISKIEAGQLAIRNSDFDIRSTIEKSIKSVLPLALEKNLGLNYTIAPEVGEIYSDERRVEQIVLNLLSNAIKYTKEGSVKLTCWVDTKYCYLCVTDTGIGIAAKDLDKLFAPFSQIVTKQTQRVESTGLGLSICKKLISLMNGTICVESTEGKGSSFTAKLPIAKDVSNKEI